MVVKCINMRCPDGDVSRRLFSHLYSAMKNSERKTRNKTCLGPGCLVSASRGHTVHYNVLDRINILFFCVPTVYEIIMMVNCEKWLTDA